MNRMLAATRKALMYAAAAALCLAGLESATIPAAAQKNNQDPELQMGQEVFDGLKAKAEVIQSSPLYDTLKPIAEAITQAAQPRYNHPFKFYLVHEPKPNAFAAPGGNVYVVDSLLYFAKNNEELVGTLCHEVSHTIHHDTMTLMEEQKRIVAREIGASILLGANGMEMLAIALAGKLHSLSYSRAAESRADLTGSDICASAGYNPWGLVWLFQDFQNAGKGKVPQLLSDHPSNLNRVKALEDHFRKNAATFGKFNSDPKSGTSIAVPKDAPEVFLR